MQITDNQINSAVIAAFKLRKKSTCDEVTRSILKKFVNTIFDEFWYVPNVFTFTYQCKSKDVSNRTNCIIETITELLNYLILLALMCPLMTLVGNTILIILLQPILMFMLNSKLLELHLKLLAKIHY